MSVPMRRAWITFLRIFRYGVRNFSRNAWLTTAATAVMTITLLVIATTFAARMVFNDTVQQVRQKIDVSVYLKDNVTDDQRQHFIDELKRLPIVTSVDFISKDQARAIFQQQNKQDLTQLEALGALEGKNPFPPSLKVKTRDPNRLDALNAVINTDANKQLQSDPPSYSGEQKLAIDNIAHVSQFLETAGLVTAVVFAIISILIIFNTIRMAIFSRKDEIEIMRLIGAEKYFIRGPFIVEASLYGVLAAIISISLVYALLLTHGTDLARSDIVVNGTIMFFKRWVVLVVFGQVVIGIVIGIFSSLLAMRRYLKI